MENSQNENIEKKQGFGAWLLIVAGFIALIIVVKLVMNYLMK